MSNAIGSSRESNSTQRICNLRAVSVGIDDIGFYCRVSQLNSSFSIQEVYVTRAEVIIE